MNMSLLKHSLVHLLCLCVIFAAVAARPGKTRKYSSRNSQDQRLVGGEPVSGTNYSFLASLRVMPKELHRCAGFLVSHIHVMTTATCIYSTGTKELHAYMNPLRFDNLGTYIRVKEATSHPNFTLTPHENDVAILKLVKSFDVEYPVIPNWVEVPPKTNVVTFGWGYDKVPGGVGNFTLHMLKLQIMSNGMCSLVLREYLGCDTLCATSPIQFATSPADAGTPLIYVGDDGKMFAVGMLVKETDDMVNAAPYMALRKFLEWSETVTSPRIPTEPPTTTTTTTTSTTAGEDNVDETTTTTESPPATPNKTPVPGEEDEYGDIFHEDYQEQPIKGRSRKRAAFQRQMFRDGSFPMAKRQISHFG